MQSKKRDTIPPEYRKGFLRRTKAAREAVKHLYPTIREFEEAMGLPDSYWKQYESRTILPPHRIELFCRLTGTSAWYLITGKHASDEPQRPEDPAKHIKKQKYVDRDARTSIPARRRRRQ